MLKKLRHFIGITSPVSPPQLAYREQLVVLYEHLTDVSRKAALDIAGPRLTGAVVGHIFKQALIEAGVDPSQLGREDLLGIAVRLTYAYLSVNRLTGYPNSEADLRNALSSIDPLFGAGDEAGQALPKCLKQVHQLRSGPNAFKPIAEENLVLQYIETADRATLGLLGQQLVNEIHARRSAEPLYDDQLHAEFNS